MTNKKNKFIGTYQFYPDTIENWAYADKLFTPEECAQIIKIGNSKLQKAFVGEKNKIDGKIRESQIAWLGPDEIEFAFQRITNVVCNLNEQFFKFDLFGMAEGIQFTRYDAPTGHYGTHIDKMFNGVVRKLSLTIQLSEPDDYEGGELALHFESKPIVMSKELGAAVAFPSYVLHEVRPVTKGTRYSLVVWITGKPFK